MLSKASVWISISHPLHDHYSHVGMTTRRKNSLKKTQNTREPEIWLYCFQSMKIKNTREMFFIVSNYPFDVIFCANVDHWPSKIKSSHTHIFCL